MKWIFFFRSVESRTVERGHIFISLNICLVFSSLRKQWYIIWITLAIRMVYVQAKYLSNVCPINNRFLNYHGWILEYICVRNLSWRIGDYTLYSQAPWVRVSKWTNLNVEFESFIYSAIHISAFTSLVHYFVNWKEKLI